MSKVVRAHTNIALIKYWGKKDEILRIPTNSSLSLTLDNFYTDTSVEYDCELKADVFVLDGVEQEGNSLRRVRKFMDFIRDRYGISEYARIESFNHVPTAAGLASSASAFAALAKAATLHLNLDDVELSRLARMGSGSASRSIYGGFAQWHMGSNDLDSYATALDVGTWDDFVMIACLINQKEKPFSSSEAMHITSEKSVYFDAFVQQSHLDIENMKTYIKERDIHKVGQLAQENALRMHASLMAVNMWYFEPETLKVMNIVRSLQKDIPVYFTMDAGPNVKILTLDRHVDEVLKALGEIETVISHSGPGIHVL